MMKKNVKDEIKQLEMELCMAEIKKDIEYIKKGLDEQKMMMTQFMDESAKKYAMKYVEEKLSRLEKRQNKIEIILSTAYGALIIIYAIAKLVFKL